MAATPQFVPVDLDAHREKTWRLASSIQCHGTSIVESGLCPSPSLAYSPRRRIARLHRSHDAAKLCDMDPAAPEIRFTVPMASYSAPPCSGPSSRILLPHGHLQRKACARQHEGQNFKCSGIPRKIKNKTRESKNVWDTSPGSDDGSENLK